MASPDLEVAIVSYNVRELLRACLESVFRCAGDEGLRARVWVLDNASADGSADMVERHFAAVLVRRRVSNLGFAGGANALLVEGAGERAPLLLLNPDTEVRPGALTFLLEDVQALPRAGIVGPGLIYGDGSLQHSAFRFPGLVQTFLEFFPVNWRLQESGLNGRYPLQERRPWPFLCDHPLGAAMMLRPEMLREVGAMDSGFFMYCEEVDWCWRAWRAGWEVWSDPRAVVVHHAGQSTGQARPAMYVQLWRSRYRLFSKHRGCAYAGAVRLVVRAGLARERRRLAGQHREGRMTEAALRQSLDALDAVARL
ncbi:MAG: glycosyltransferase family 2 protein [Anaerolineae bacterium]|nr:glycosyltransferase family 2 protein [Anaerolineae bacterium]